MPNEFAHGSIMHRPWAAILEDEALVEVLSIGLVNVTYLYVRSSDAGIDQRILLRTFAYLILTALDRLPAENVAGIVFHSLTRGREGVMPEKAQEFLLMPIADQLLSEMQDICTADCERVLPFRRGALTEDKDEVENYWLRLEPKGMEEPKDRRTLRMEAYDKPCLVGFAVDKDHHCPLFTFEPVVKNFSDFLWIIKRVAAFRKREAAMERREKAARDETAKHSRRNPTKTDAP